VPQFVTRAIEGRDANPVGSVPFEIQGDGAQTRAFCFVDDIVNGVLTMYARGGHREIYNIGNDEQVTIRDLAHRVGRTLGVELDIRTGESAASGTPRRCPDITKMRSLGYRPEVSLDEGLQRTVAWYLEHSRDTVTNELL
jgi:UDP-glucose 4-epimerase